MALKLRSDILDLDHVKLSLGINFFLSCLMESLLHQLSGSTFIFVKNTHYKFNVSLNFICGNGSNWKLWDVIHGFMFLFEVRVLQIPKSVPGNVSREIHLASYFRENTCQPGTGTSTSAMTTISQKIHYKRGWDDVAAYSRLGISAGLSSSQKLDNPRHQDFFNRPEQL